MSKKFDPEAELKKAGAKVKKEQAKQQREDEGRRDEHKSNNKRRG